MSTARRLVIPVRDFATVLLMILGIGAFSHSALAQGVPVHPREAPAPSFSLPDTAHYVSYYDTTETAYFFALPDDSARLALRFSPPTEGVADSVFFAIDNPSSGNPSPIDGEGQLRVRLAGTRLLAGSGADAVIVPGAYQDSACIPLSQLQLGTFNAIDLPEVAVADTADYIVEFDVIASSDSASVQFVLDSGSSTLSDEDYFPARTRLALVHEDTTTYERFIDLRDQSDAENHNLVAAVQISGQTGSDVADHKDKRSASLGANYPNPVRKATTIPFLIEQPARVKLAIYDVLGRRVATLADRRMSAGMHRVAFRPDELPAGTYVYRLTVDGGVQQRLMAVVQ